MGRGPAGLSTGPGGRACTIGHVRVSLGQDTGRRRGGPAGGGVGRWMPCGRSGRGPRADPPLAGWTRCATGRRCGGSCATWSPTTTSGRCTAGCRRSATSSRRGEGGVGQRRRVRAAAALLRRPDGRGDLGQRARPGVRRPRRRRRADDDDPRRTSRCATSSSGCSSLAAGGSTCQLAVRRRHAARRLAAARRHPRHHPASTGRSTSASSSSRPTRWTTSSRSGTLTPQAAALPRGGRRGRAQRPRLRRHAGRQDDAAQLPGGGRPGPRAGRHVRGGLRAARSRCRDVVALQCRQPSLEGTGEVPLRRLVKEALRMRPVPDHRRRGAPGGEPRPAHRPELRPARACAPSTPTAPARR